MKIVVVLLIAALTVQSSFAQDNLRYSETPLFDSASIVIEENVVYGNAIHAFTGLPEPLEMDVYYPNANVDATTNRPLILCIHGGGFIGGDKSEMAYQAIEFARRGFVVANINYRLGWNCDNVLCVNCYGSNLQKAIYSAVQDARAALRYCAAHASAYGLNPHQIFINGQSAGAITGIQCAIWSQDEAIMSIPNGFELIAGDLNGSGNNESATYSVLGIINQCGAIDDLAHYNESIPIIHFHDSNDCIVPYQYGALISCFCSGFLSYNGSFSIHSALQTSGKCSQLHTAPQVLPNHCTYPQSSVIKQSACFMKSILNGYCVGISNSDIYASPLCSYTIQSNNLPGCTYSNALNFNPNAILDDGSCEFAITCAEDLNQDGVIGVNDLLLILGSYGQTCNP